MTTARFSSEPGAKRDADTTSTWNRGVVPMDSAFDRKRLGSPVPLSTTRIDTGSLGLRTELNVLSAGIGSSPTFTEPRTFAPDSVNSLKVTELDDCGSTLARSVSMSCPSTLSVTGTSVSLASPLLLMPDVTVMRSWPEKFVLANDTDGTDALVVPSVATD